MLKKIYLICAFFLFGVSLFLGLDRACHHRSSHFCLNRIRTSNLFSSQGGAPLLSSQEREELRQVLRQKFILYDKGSHAYVCISEDGKYVLKFLKYQHLNKKSWLSALPFSFNPFYQEFLLKKTKCLALLDSWKIAFTQLKTETGLLYMHTDNTQKLDQKITILDQDLQEHWVDLDKVVFCVQKHADLLYFRIAQLMSSGDVDGAKKIITSIFTLLDSLSKKGVVDAYLCSDLNWGLVDNDVIQLDLSKLHIDLTCCRHQSCRTERLERWLEQNYPELFEYFRGHL